MQKSDILTRLNQMAEVICRDEHTLALIALGSVAETDRLDAFSDIDFFLVVEDAYKQTFIRDLWWLEQTYPVAYAFKNTEDGYKIFFEDGIYGEFAVFGASEMSNVTMSKGRIVWQRDTYQGSDLEQPKGKIHALKKNDLAYAFDEALTNLYVGLSRALRGESLSAHFFIEHHAFSQLLGILHHLEVEHKASDDIFGLERRIEIRFPTFIDTMAMMLQGYNKLGASAEAIYRYIGSHTTIHPFLESQIIALIAKVKDIDL